MAAEIQSFTRVSLQLAVQKFQVETQENLLKEHDIQLPKEIKDLIAELESIKTFEDAPDLHNSDDEYGEPYEPNDQLQQHADFNNKQKLLNTILKRINRSKDQVHKATDVQSDLESPEDSEDDARGQVIETIINQKSKSIADVLLNDGLNKFYGNFFGQSAHPYARQQKDEQVATRKKVGGDFQKPAPKDGGQTSAP